LRVEAAQQEQQQRVSHLARAREAAGAANDAARTTAVTMRDALSHPASRTLLAVISD